MCKVVNIKSGAKFDVYIGRPGCGMKGEFGSPITLNQVCIVCGKIHKTKGSSIPCYTKWFYSDLGKPIRLLARLKIKPADVLGCWCDGACHGNVISEFIMNATEFGE